MSGIGARGLWGELHRGGRGEGVGDIGRRGLDYQGTHLLHPTRISSFPRSERPRRVGSFKKIVYALSGVRVCDTEDF